MYNLSTDWSLHDRSLKKCNIVTVSVSKDCSLQSIMPQAQNFNTTRTHKQYQKSIQFTAYLTNQRFSLLEWF